MPNQSRSMRNECQGTKLIKLRRFTKRRNRSTLQTLLSGNLAFNRRAWPQGLCPPLSRHLARLGTFSLSVLNLRRCLGWHLGNPLGTEEKRIILGCGDTLPKLLCPKLCRITTMNSKSQTSALFFGKSQAVYLRFCWSAICCGWRLAVYRSNPA